MCTSNEWERHWASNIVTTQLGTIPVSTLTDFISISAPVTLCHYCPHICADLGVSLKHLRSQIVIWRIRCLHYFETILVPLKLRKNPRRLFVWCKSGINNYWQQSEKENENLRRQKYLHDIKCTQQIRLKDNFLSLHGINGTWIITVFTRLFTGMIFEFLLE